jgi:hypothetical protein
VDGTLFDRLTASLARRGSRRIAFGIAAGTMLAAGTAIPASARTFDRDCRRFRLAAGDDPDRRFNNLDDNLLVEVQRKGGRNWETVWDDTNDDNVNFRGEPFRIPPFDAKVGDKLRIQAFNLGGSCELDEIWLFCERGRHNDRGKRLTAGVGRDDSCAEGQFFEETYRIRP